MATSRRYHRLSALAMILLPLLLLMSSSSPFQPAHAQGMVRPSSGGSLDVVLDPEWGDGGQGGQGAPAQFRLTFLQPGTETTQQHIDYDLVVKDDSGGEVFRATDLLNQPVLHTEPGTVTIPYEFEENGSYTVEVEMYGILFNPIAPETAEFSVNVVPEFPAAALGVTAAAVMAGTMVLKRKLR
jgi:hypothetical protein